MDIEITNNNNRRSVERVTVSREMKSYGMGWSWRRTMPGRIMNEWHSLMTRDSALGAFWEEE